MSRRKGLFQFNGVWSIFFYAALLGLLWYLIVPRSGLFFRRFFYRPYIGQLNIIDKTLILGETEHIYVIGINKRVRYSSTDIKVADVTIFGGVRTYRPGTTFIKVKVDGKTRKCRIRVIAINKKKVSLSIGESFQLKIKGSLGIVKWESSDSSIVKIEKNGKIVGLRKGNAKITATVHGRKLHCNVTIKG